MHKLELAAALVDGCVELISSSAGSSSAGSSTVGSSSAGSSSGVLGWSRAATPLRVQADVAQAKHGFELAHAARVERGTHARTSARHPRRRRRGSCGGRSGRGGSRGRAPVLFADALRSFVGAQGREAHQAHPPRRRRPLRNPVGDSNGSGGANLDWDSSSDGSGEVMVLGEEDRVEALPWGARSV